MHISRIILIVAAVVFGAQFVPAQMPASSPETIAIKQTALDYIEGWYEANSERMERSLHPDLVKRLVYVDAKSGKNAVQETSALALVQKTKAGGGSYIPPEKRLKEVIVLDVFQNAATVKVVAATWVDYMHIVKWNSRWVILNVLWERNDQSK